MQFVDLINNLIEAVKTNKMTKEEAMNIAIKERDRLLAEDAKELFGKK